MADNTDLNPGTGGDTIATDDVGGVKYQRVKLSLGADGTAGDAPVGGGVESGVLRVTIASDSTGVLSVDDNGGSLTVDGTVTINAIPAGTNNIGDVDILTIAAGDNNIGNVDIASIAAGDNNIGNVDVVTLPALPAGTNNIGDIDVLSVVPGSGATNLGKAEDAAHTSGDVGVMSLFVRQDSQADFGADGDYVPGSVDADGGLRVSIISGAGSGGTAAADDADFTAGTTQGTPAMGVYESTPTSVTDGDLGTVGITQQRELKVNISSGGITAATHDSAANADGVQLMGVGSSSAPSAVSANGDATRVWVTTSGAVNIADAGGSVTVDNGGTFATQATQSGTWTVQPGNTANTTAWLTSPRPAASGGLTIFRSLDLDETEEEIKATAGQLYGYYFANTNASARYLKFYNATAANVTVGSTTPVLTFYLPPSSAGHVEFSHGVAFGTAITAAATTGVADADTGAPSANDVILNAFYT